jgi:hypothetical protein
MFGCGCLFKQVKKKIVDNFSKGHVWFKVGLNSFSQNNTKRFKEDVGYGSLSATLKGMQQFINKIYI